MKKRRSFSRELKREAAGMVLDQGFSIVRSAVNWILEKRVYGAGLSRFISSTMVVFQNQKH